MLKIYGQSGGTGILFAGTRDGKNCTLLNNSSAGIGGYNSRNGGTITINGGNVTAIGKKAGIGGANRNEITINGGTVKATGGNSNPGIGSFSSVDFVAITIRGGIVTATGGSHGAGIGNGNSGKSISEVSITGGIVTATGGSGEADASEGIGKGNSESTDVTLTLGANVKLYGDDDVLDANPPGDKEIASTARKKYMKTLGPISYMKWDGSVSNQVI